MARLLNCLIFDKQICVSIINSTDIVQRANKLLGLSPVACAALGRLLTFAAIKSGTLKNKTDYFSIAINGGGEIGALTVCGTGKLSVKGSVGNPFVNSGLTETGKLDVGKAVGKNGKLTLVANYGGKEPYIGTSSIVTGEIAEDIVNYYTQSEQQSCALALGVTVDKNGNCSSAGGVFLQVLPNCSEDAILQAEQLLPKFNNISKQFGEKTIEELTKEWFGDDCEQSGVFEPSYKCDCNKRRMEKVLITLGEQELNQIVEQQGKVEIICHFCNKTYEFDKQAVEQLICKCKKKK